MQMEKYSCKDNVSFNKENTKTTIIYECICALNNYNTCADADFFFHRGGILLCLLGVGEGLSEPFR